MDFGKFTASDLRLLLEYLPQLEAQYQEATELANQKPHLFVYSAPHEIGWCNLYELPILEHISCMVVGFDMTDAVKGAARSAVPMRTLLHSIDKFDLEFDEVDKDEIEVFVKSCYTLATSVYKTIQCLLTFGCYLNDLIAQVRENVPGSDAALFNAVRIDPSVIGCPSVVARISRAAVLADTSFFNDLKRAINGPLAKRSQANFQKMRLVLQVLREANAPKLSDDELYRLFVKELALYAEDAERGDAKKNLNKFARTYRTKSTTHN